MLLLLPLPPSRWVLPGSQQSRCARPHQLVVLLGKQQDATDVGLVVVEWVELRRGHVEGPGLWEAIVQLLIEREQVHIVHGDVVCAVAALQKARVDECCPVEPVQGTEAGPGVVSLLSPNLCMRAHPSQHPPPVPMLPSSLTPTSLWVCPAAHLPLHLSHKCLLRTYYVPETIQSTGDTAMRNQNSQGADILIRRDKNKQVSKYVTSQGVVSAEKNSKAG